MVDRPREAIARSTLLLVLALASSAPRVLAETPRPFDPRSCWCNTRFLDVSLGHFETGPGERDRFIIDTPLWNGPKAAARQPGAEVYVNVSATGGSGPHLLFDQSHYAGWWCLVPVGSSTPSEITLRTTECYYLTARGAELPEGCDTEVALPDLVAFSQEAEATQDCLAAATKHLGAEFPDREDVGCSGATLPGALALLALSLRGRRRAR
ncbi:MAG TPA: hypothetical protein PK095_17175 [Myxococcota bacterium]|nr:hypothetical protein [Myxococcota bacterium]